MSHGHRRSDRTKDGCRTTVQQRGQNHHSRATVSSSIRMSRAMATKVPSDWKNNRRLAHKQHVMSGQHRLVSTPCDLRR